MKIYISRDKYHEYYEFFNKKNYFAFEIPAYEVSDKLYKEYIEAKKRFDEIYDKIAEICEAE